MGFMDKAKDFADDKTGGKYTDKIDQAGDFVKDKAQQAGDAADRGEHGQGA